MNASTVDTFYRNAPLGARLHIAGRWCLFPFPALTRYVPRHGTLVDLGCGHGVWPIYLAARHPRLTVWGVDPDREKIELARTAARHSELSNLHFEAGRAQDMVLPLCDTISMIDVLYLIPYNEQESILNAAVQRLQPGGQLLLKEMSREPAWKYAWNWFEEYAAVRVFSITIGKQFFFRQDEEWRQVLQALGLRVRVIRLDRGYLHPHVLFLGEKP
jgi:2-polyprenyl-3-methyl-5-hydroxy-6-metoxy-1,4-benzoquinol methylase